MQPTIISSSHRVQGAPHSATELLEKLQTSIISPSDLQLPLVCGETGISDLGYIFLFRIESNFTASLWHIFLLLGGCSSDFAF